MLTEHQKRATYKKEWRRKKRLNPEYRERENKYNKEYRARTGKGTEINRRWVGRRKAYHRQYLLKKKFGLTIERWEEIFVSQGRLCAICNSPENTTRYNWHVDHCHATGEIRGILCHSCNTAIDLLKDNIATLKSAIMYLSKETYV